MEDCFNCISISEFFFIILRFGDNLSVGGNRQLENYEMGKGKYETGSVRTWHDAIVNLS